MGTILLKLLTLLLIMNLEVKALNLGAPGCTDENGNTYAIGDSVNTSDPCEMCHCGEDGDIICAMMACLPCARMHVDVEGSCCGECHDFNVRPMPLIGCERNGVHYDIGETVETSDPCEICHCSENDDVVCATIDCPLCSGRVVPVEGQCCGKCFVGEVEVIPGTGCALNGTVYGYGDTIPTDDPCETCFCDRQNRGDITCLMKACMPCQGIQVPVEGSCCGVCHSVTVQPVVGCERNGTHYDVGPFTDPDDKCNACECNEDGTITCEEMVCPSTLSCKKTLVIQPEDQCCPVCQCLHKKKKYMPGPVGDVCDGCVCEAGEVTCRPAPCRRMGLTCVDQVRDDNCCMYCPNGTTCRIGKTVIRGGEYTKVGNKYCMCAGDPWYPNAFCAQKKINSSFRKKYGEYLADYTLPGV